VLTLWLVPAISHRTAATGSIRSLAVLPLDNLSGDSSQDYFADAMTDELITDLAKVGALRITSRTTVTLYKHTNKTLPVIARELNMDGIVEGSIVRSGADHCATDPRIGRPAYLGRPLIYSDCRFLYALRAASGEPHACYSGVSLWTSRRHPC
jgi:hypothetical protein